MFLLFFGANVMLAASQISLGSLLLVNHLFLSINDQFFRLFVNLSTSGMLYRVSHYEI
jgi:hypothetical protein